MLEKIGKLEMLARQLEPSPEIRRQWNNATQKYADFFLDSLATRNAFDYDDERSLGILHLTLQDAPRSIDELLAALSNYVDTSGINPASGKHFGYVPGGGIFPTALGDYLAAVTNRYAGIFFANPGAVRIENQLIRWMCNLIGYPEGSLGNLASGGSIANLIAITTARDVKGVTHREVEKAVVYLTHQVHHCIQKALRLAGLGAARLRYVPMDSGYRMDVAILWEMITRDKAEGLHPFLVIGSAGTTDTGAIDPLHDIADIAQEYGLWFHVDAAYGGFFMLIDDLRHKFRGIGRSDSLAIDPHKGLFLSYGIGAVLVRDVEAQFRSHHYQANYMQDALPDEIGFSPADLSPELTKHWRGLRMWLPLQLLGITPFRAALEEKVLLCRYFYEQIRNQGFETGPTPELSIMIFRYLPASGDANTFNEALVDYVRNDGRVFLSSTTLEGTYWIRLAVLSFRSHLREVDLCLEILAKGVEELWKTEELKN